MYIFYYIQLTYTYQSTIYDFTNNTHCGTYFIMLFMTVILVLVPSTYQTVEDTYKKKLLHIHAWFFLDIAFTHVLEPKIGGV